MKHTLFLLGLLAAFRLSAQSPQQVRVNLHNATVFLSGAELSSSARVNLPAGESDVLFTNIAGNVRQESLNIGASGNAVIQSATFQNNYLADSALSPRAVRLRDSIALLSVQIASTADRRQVLQEQADILNQNKKVGGQNSGLSVAELARLLDLVDTRLSKILAEQRSLNDKVAKTQARVNLLNQQLAEERQKAYTPGGQLLVKFYAKSPVTADVNMSYVVPNAGWTPSYDLRVEKVNAPVQLYYKASVYQNSGVSWNNVRLSLSTGNPTEGVEAPTLQPWLLSFYSPAYNMPQPRPANTISLNRAYGANAFAPGTEPAPGHGEADEMTLSRYTAVDAGGINTTFEIELPYSIPTDGQQHTVAIKDYELPATYRHFAVPKLDKDAFLQAQITRWEDLNLLPAQTNVFFEGSYVGQGFIDMRNVRDTMYLSLGRDKKIIIRREREKNFQHERTVGSNERQSFAWNISVRNTRREAVHLVVLDQLPVSTDDDIVVEDAKWGDAQREEKTGGLRWTLDLKPSESRKLPWSYTIRYPRGKSLGMVGQ